MITDRNSEDRSFRQISQTIQTDLEAVRSTATDFEQQLQTFVRERPVAAVLAALGLGFVVARIFARR
ncbi:MAG TPA: hypothetical protein VEC57_12350 [Candidatus Limnocylindrales bacterium]|nr:hypothetical protein [Candidatus Limnocylindrales bacterium]